MDSISDSERLKSAKVCIGRAYRNTGNAMSLMSPTADAANVRYAIAQLEMALASLRGTVSLTVYAPEYWPTGPTPSGWYSVDYSLPRSLQCPTGRASLRLLASSDADAIARAALVLEGRGLEFRARINFARKDA